MEYSSRLLVSLKALDTLAQLLDDPSPHIVKTAVQCLATVYVLVFRHMYEVPLTAPAPCVNHPFRCTNRSNPLPWHTLTTCKTRILEFLWSNTTNAGVKLAAMKFAQRVVLVQIRGVSDPRVARHSLLLNETAFSQITSVTAAKQK